MRHYYLGTAILQYIGDLGGLAVPVDRHAIGAEPLRRIARLKERKVIAQYKRDGIARPDPERRKPASCPRLFPKLAISSLPLIS